VQQSPTDQRAPTLANAGYGVTVIGGLFGGGLKARDLELQKSLPFSFQPGIDGTENTFRRFVLPARVKAGAIAHRFARLESRRQLGYAYARLRVSRTGLLATGARIILDPADLLRDVYFFGTYEPEITDLIVRNLRPGGVAFDVGANAGYYTLLMAGIMGDSGQVHSFEPNPKLGAILEDSVLMNSCGKYVFVNRVAVGASIEHELDFFVSRLPKNSGISSLRPHKWGLENNGYSKYKITGRYDQPWMNALVGTRFSGVTL
jgi:FkbM family methyltransferase